MDAEKAVAAFQKAVEDTPKGDRVKCFSQQFYRMQRYIDLKGDYFEKNFQFDPRSSVKH